MEFQGYIKVWRKLLRSRIFQNEGLFKVWIWCLLKANHKDNWVQISTGGKSKSEVLVKKGQFIFGRKTASKELRMAESSVRNRMVKLKNMRNLDTQTYPHYTIITILNWLKYQGNDKKEDRRILKKRTGGGQAEDTNKNDKNVKKDMSSIKDSSFLKSLRDFFREATSREKGFTPEISWAKDTKLLKQRLNDYSVEELKSLIEFFLKSKKADDGVSLSACLSAHTINQWKQNNIKNKDLYE